MSLALCLGGVEARALEHDVYADLAPRKVLCVLFGIDLDGLAADGDGAGFVIGGHGVCMLVSALCGVILEKMREHLGAGQVVDRDDLIPVCAEHLTERKAADPAEAIDCNSYICHNT